MTESTHDRIASKAARLEDLIALAKSGAAAAGVPEAMGPVADELPPSPSWSGGWNN